MLIPSNKFSLKFSKIGDNWGFGTSLTAVKLFEAECDNINPFAIIHTMENLGNLSNRKRRNFPAPANLAGMHQDKKWVLFRKTFENFDDIFNHLASPRHWTVSSLKHLHMESLHGNFSARSGVEVVQDYILHIIVNLTLQYLLPSLSTTY